VSHPSELGFAGTTLDARSQFGRYRIDGELGRGGMGTVLRAWDPQLQRTLAIKVVRHGGDQQHAARLIREAQSLARLSHPNVCHVYDVGSEGAEVWFAMELIDGVTLREWAKDRSRDEILGALIGAARGLGAAHRAGLVHRDVKPENVMIERGGRAVVTDFGIARFEEHSTKGHAATQLTSTGAIFGTPAYMAPEQLSGEIADARADQFAWALSAWELLLGRPPFPLELAPRFVAIHDGIEPPRELAPPLGAALVRALANDPARRFASMEELIAGLDSTVAVRARSRRRWPLLAGGGLVVVGAGIAIIASMRGASETPATSPLPTAGSAAPSGSAAPPPPAVAPHEVLPAGYERIDPLRPAEQVDPQAEWTRARDLTAKRYPDAKVESLTAMGVTSDGFIDLVQGGAVFADFRSPGALRAAAAYWGASMALQKTGGYLTQVSGGGNDESLKRLAAWPRCTVRDIWKRATAKRKVPAGGVAEVHYYVDAFHQAQWLFMFGEVRINLRDDCPTSAAP
jgi:predicted Ser/Thr protein kinase